MNWELLVNPIVIETLQYYDEEVATSVLAYLEHQLLKMPQPQDHADNQNSLSGIMTFSRTTHHGVVMIFAQLDYDSHRIKILHVQLRNNAFDKL